MPENRPFGLGIVKFRCTPGILPDCAIFYKGFFYMLGLPRFARNDKRESPPRPVRFYIL